MKELTVERSNEAIYERKANYYETDQMSVIHHSNYIRWFEEARLYYMEEAGLPYELMEEAGILIPVLGVSCDYKISVKYGQTVMIHVSIASFNGIRMKCKYEVYEKASGVLCSVGESDHCFVTKAFKPVSLKKSYPQFYEVLKNAADL